MRRQKPSPVFYLLSGDYSPRPVSGSWRPNADIYETADHVVVALEVAGVRPEDLEITALRDRLTVRGVRRPEPGERAERFHQIEIVCGEFEKEIILSEQLRGAPVEAVLAHGILSIRIDKNAAVDAAAPKQIKIEAE